MAETTSTKTHTNTTTARVWIRNEELANALCSPTKPVSRRRLPVYGRKGGEK